MALTKKIGISFLSSVILLEFSNRIDGVAEFKKDGK